MISPWWLMLSICVLAGTLAQDVAGSGSPTYTLPTRTHSPTHTYSPTPVPAPVPTFTNRQIVYAQPKQTPKPEQTPKPDTHHYHTIHGAMCVSHSGARRVEIRSLEGRGVVDMQMTGYQQDWMSGLLIVNDKSIEFTLEAVDWYPYITVCAIEKSGSGPIIVLFIDEPTNLRLPTTNILAGLGMCLLLAAIFCLCAATLTRPVKDVVDAPNDGKTLPYTIYDVSGGTSICISAGEMPKSSVLTFSAPPKSAL